MRRVKYKTARLLTAAVAATLAAAALAVAVAVLAGCTREQPVLQHSEGEAEMQFTVTIPTEKATPVSSTRAVGSDVDIQNIDLLVFNYLGQIQEQVQATDITLKTVNAAAGAAQYTFKARLGISTTARTLYIFANSRNAETGDERVSFSKIGGERSANAIIPNLYSSITQISLSRGAAHALVPPVMWGKISLGSITSSQTIAEHVKLLRQTAAIKVSTNVPDFTVHRISTNHSPDGGWTAPDNWSTWNNSNAATPSEMSTRPVFPRFAYFNAADPYDNDYWTVPPDLHYIFETRGSDPPAVIIDATYKGVRGYYKIVMKNPLGETFDLVRNHRYIVNIVAVNTPGNPDLPLTSAGTPSNDDLVFYVDDHEELVSFVTDGKHYMGISNEQVTIKRGTGLSSSHIFEFAKVYASRSTLRAGALYPLNTILSGVSVSAPDANGLCTVNARVTGTGAGMLFVTDGTGNQLSLQQDIYVEVSGVSQEAVTGNGTYAGEDLLPRLTADTPSWWSVEIVEGSLNVFMNTSNQGQGMMYDTSGSNWGEWGITSISSDGFTAPYLYLILPKGSSNIFSGTLICRYLKEGQVIVEKIICKGS